MFDWLLNTPLHLVYLVKQYPDGITFSKLTIETLEQGIKYVQSSQ